MKLGLQHRLLLLLLLPLGIFALAGIYLDYRSAGNAALRKDPQLQHLLPLLADSVLPSAAAPGSLPVLLLAPELDAFIKARVGMAGVRVSDSAGNYLIGEPWIAGVLPATLEPEFVSTEFAGVTYRIGSQRVATGSGELILQIADGSDSRQQWLSSLWLRVLLPDLLLLLTTGFAVKWAVARALRPLIALKEAVERRSPRDLSAIDLLSTPAEVQPLVSALNRLFGLVNDQAEGQRRFVADAAHQLRTPLAGLQAQVEAWTQAASLSAGAVTLTSDKLLKLRGATRRTSQLANQLLALSRADSFTHVAQAMQAVDLKKLCESVLYRHLDAATDKGLDLGLEALPAQARGYEWLLAELLSNLADNAVKYTAIGGCVTIRCGVLPALLPAEPSRVFLEVEDDGPGLEPAERPLALQRFYRVHGTAGDGNGLGLAIADEIARAHQSQLELDYARSLAPRGLRVRLVLQAQPAAQSTS
ncbi:Sensor protein QseC [Polaromonas vacuolata]|uniref:histidine kinase n=1 Tax=Polaromonas vacuolata TaxID=37448 RepID=A0A6H2HD38_9BURK|nr:ATP-binding protein [Polaromonas vacuolata]QJC57801.1 Sensor protein QseC [Polaromonas vacuolata]